MPDRGKIVAVSLLTQPEFELWGHKLRHVYLTEDAHDFDDLITAIDKADLDKDGQVTKPPLPKSST